MSTFFNFLPTFSNLDMVMLFVAFAVTMILMLLVGLARMGHECDRTEYTDTDTDQAYDERCLTAGRQRAAEHAWSNPFHD